MAEEEKDIPASGAVFTFGRSRFADNIPSHFFIRNDPVVDVDCGDEHTVVVCQNGRVFVFGSNEWGQLGLGHRSVVTKPSCLKSLKPEQATHVACGRAHTIVSTGSGKVFGFGNNSDGQLGVGDTEDRDNPTPLEGIVGPVEQLSAGCHHSVALNNRGEVFVWGSNSDGQIGLGEDIKSVTSPTRLYLKESIAKIACGYYHTVLLTEEGQVLVCGEGDAGKLGLGSTDSVYIPTQVSIEAWLVYVAAGGNHTIAVAVDGKVYGWGSNFSGQLGLPSVGQIDVLTPSLVHTLCDKIIEQVACGESHSAFITEQGVLLTCGETRHGKLGCEATGSDPSFNSEPMRVSRFKPYTVTKVRCGGCHTMVLASPRKEDTDDHLSNGHVAISSLQPPEVDIESPPIITKGPLPPLQRVPHISSSSLDGKVSREGSLASLPRPGSDSHSQGVPDISVDLVHSEDTEKVDTEREEDPSNISLPKSTPETVSINEKTCEGHDEDNGSIITMKQQQGFDALDNLTEAVEEKCERAVSKTKSTVDNNASEVYGVAGKIMNKKSKMCTLL